MPNATLARRSVPLKQIPHSTKTANPATLPVLTAVTAPPARYLTTCAAGVKRSQAVWRPSSEQEVNGFTRMRGGVTLEVPTVEAITVRSN